MTNLAVSTSPTSSKTARAALALVLFSAALSIYLVFGGGGWERAFVGIGVW